MGENGESRTAWTVRRSYIFVSFSTKIWVKITKTVWIAEITYSYYGFCWRVQIYRRESSQRVAWEHVESIKRYVQYSSFMNSVRKSYRKFWYTERVYYHITYKRQNCSIQYYNFVHESTPYIRLPM